MPAANSKVPTNPDGTQANTFIGTVPGTGVVFSNGGRLESNGQVGVGVTANRAQLPSAGELGISDEPGHTPVINSDATFVPATTPIG